MNTEKALNPDLVRALIEATDPPTNARVVYKAIRAVVAAQVQTFDQEGAPHFHDDAIEDEVQAWERTMLGAPVEALCVVPDSMDSMNVVEYMDPDFILRDQQTTWTVTADSASDAAEAARDAMEPDDRTTFYRVMVSKRIWSLTNYGAVYDSCVEIETFDFTIDPTEPDCAEDSGHDWHAPHSVVGGLTENPGVHGNGGGVIVTEVCRHCRRYKRTNTWATNPTDGTQGHTTISYEPADEASNEWSGED